eukprot:1545866-Pleurochrysis_carterae.AAC.3
MRPLEEKQNQMRPLEEKLLSSPTVCSARQSRSASDRKLGRASDCEGLARGQSAVVRAARVRVAAKDAWPGACARLCVVGERGHVFQAVDVAIERRLRRRHVQSHRLLSRHAAHLGPRAPPETRRNKRK